MVPVTPVGTARQADDDDYSNVNVAQTSLAVQTDFVCVFPQRYLPSALKRTDPTEVPHSCE